MPFVPPAFRPLVQAACAPLQQRQARGRPRPPAARSPTSAPRSARAFAADPAMFSADRFHPSSAGYARIAEALAPTVLAAARARRDDAAA